MDDWCLVKIMLFDVFASRFYLFGCVVGLWLVISSICLIVLFGFFLLKCLLLI